MKFSILYTSLFVLLCANISAAQPVIKVGDQGKNLSVIPTWTMRTCPKELYATYDLDGAKALKQADADCAFMKLKLQHLETQTTAFKTVVQDLKSVVELQKQTQTLDQTRINDLTKQLKTEIAEKNTYKYKPNYNWLWISIGAAVALAGVSFGVGMWVSR